MKALSPKILLPLLTLVAAVLLALWSPHATEPPHQGLPIANRQLVTYHTGLNAWIALTRPDEQFVGLANQSVSEVQAAQSRATQLNHSWGGPHFWLPLPECQISIWWIITLCAVVIVLITVHANKQKHGFPITPHKT
ncbi:MAG TPA: hypothetical protein VFE58_11835 [Tepidisphaeraceae bacterium]|jgi:hypothetical protein|nr:hypothetical protein [Tepidisphaeraceae bacterium]